MSVVKPVASDSPGWIARVMQWIPRVHVRVEVPARDGGRQTSETPKGAASAHPSLVPNPDRKSWETLYDDFDPLGEDFLAERPLNVVMKE